MGQARRLARVALSGFVATSLCLVTSGLALGASAGPEVLDWKVDGALEAGGMYSVGERSSSKFKEYRDMDNGFVGELSLRGEKKDQPYFFEFKAKNPARDDQGYEGLFGRYGLFKLEMGWDRTPHVLSTTTQTIFQESKGRFTLPSTLRGTIAKDTNAAACGTTTSWTCPVEFAVSNTTAAIGATQSNFIRDTINGLLRPVDLSFNTDVARVGVKVTPMEEWQFDLEYSNLRRQGYRPVGVVIGSPGGAVTELAIPIENYTHEVKFGAEYARPDWAVQFNYSGSIFRNEFNDYTWDNPGFFGTTDSADFVGSARAVRVNTGQISAPPDNFAHTFSLTGASALPLRSRISGTFAYTLLRQDETFLNNTVNRAIAQSNTDDAGNSSPDAKADILLTAIQLTSRPIKNVTATARYRFFEYMNDTPLHTFDTAGHLAVPEGLAARTSGTATTQERFTKQNAGFDVGWRPIRPVALKAGLEYEHWNRGDREVTSTNEYTGKFAADVTPVDWFLGQVTYGHSNRFVEGYQYSGRAYRSQLVQLVKFDEADRRRDRVDLLMQFSPWETVTPSLNFGVARDDFYNSEYGLKKNDYYTAGGSLGWNPLSWLQLSADYSYEYYKYTQQSRYRESFGGATDVAANDWESKSKDEFHTLGVNATLDLVPKKFDVTLGYAVSFGYTTIRTKNLTVPPATPSSSLAGITPNNATAFDWDKVQNVLQTVKVVGNYHFTEKFSARLGYASERYTEHDFARDPLKAFMGDVDTANAGIQSVFLGATQPNFEAHILSFLLRYDF